MAVQSFFVILNPPKAGEESSSNEILRPTKGQDAPRDDEVIAQ